MCPLQAQSVDSDCGRVAAAARDAERYELERIDDAEQRIAEAIERSKSCTDSVIQDLNRAIPSFGGGLIDSIATVLISNLARSACQLIRRSEDRVRSSVPAIPTDPSVLGLPTLPVPASTPTSGSASTSIWDRLGGIL